MEDPRINEQDPNPNPESGAVALLDLSSGGAAIPRPFCRCADDPILRCQHHFGDGIKIWWTLEEDGHPSKRLALPGEYHYPHDQYRLVFKEDCEVGRRSGSRATRGIHPQFLTPRLQRHLFEGAEHECPHGCLCKVQVPHPKGITPWRSHG